MASEFDVGKKAGLDRGRSLAADCADFYVLESLENELFPWGGDVRYKKGDFPIGFDRDLGLYDKRHEMRAYDVQRTLRGREEALAREFSVYLALACGGELRHIRRFMGGDPVTTTACVHKHVKLDCCAHNCEVWLHSADFGLPLPKCGCECNHRHGADFPCVFGYVGCAHDTDVCCGHHCQEDNGCVTVIQPYTPSSRVQKFLDALSNDAYYDASDRGLGWQHWWTLAKRTMGPWMQECADAFNHPMWYGGGDHGGYGGYKWGSAAQLCADYLLHRITARTFIDRCWSLQHNGGCIFNKFYKLVPSKRNPNKDSLMYVLETQAANHYEELAAGYCTPYVQELWKSNELRMGRMSAVDLVRKGIGEPPKKNSNWPWDSMETGCFMCWWRTQTNGKVTHPCGISQSPDPAHHGPWATNPGCGYYGMYHDAYPFAGGKGCMACYWRFTVEGKTSPCGHSGQPHGPDVLNPTCAYYGIFVQEFGPVPDGENDTDPFEDTGCSACKWYYDENDGSGGPDPCDGEGAKYGANDTCGYYESWSDAMGELD